MKEVTISARIEEQLRDELRELAQRNDRTFSQEIRRALRLHVMSEQAWNSPPVTIKVREGEK